MKGLKIFSRVRRGLRKVSQDCIGGLSRYPPFAPVALCCVL